MSASAERDIFYLEVDEVLGFVEGTATSTDLKGLTALRRAEFDGYRRAPAPDDRFQTRGVVYRGNAFRSETVGEAVSDDERRGIGCCPGVVRAVVRVITDPRTADMQSGAILVAEQTDPGWIMLFPAAAGPAGGARQPPVPLGHRGGEMGIPAIVSIPGVTRWLKDGDRVEMDGRTGTVRRLEAQAEAARDAQ